MEKLWKEVGAMDGIIEGRRGYGRDNGRMQGLWKG